jgi:hypothetical protein
MARQWTDTVSVRSASATRRATPVDPSDASSGTSTVDAAVPVLEDRRSEPRQARWPHHLRLAATAFAIVAAGFVALGVAVYIQAPGLNMKPSDRGKSDLRTAVGDTQILYDDAATYADVTPATLMQLDPHLRFGPLNAADSGTIGVAVTDHDVVLVTRAERQSHDWYCIAAVNGARPTFGHGARLNDVDSVAKCSGPSW